jgi:voltage-gated potassium channel
VAVNRKRLYADLFDRVRGAVAIAASVYVLSVLLFYAVGCLTGMNARYGRSLGRLDDDLWSFRECLYQAVITLPTIGFTDALGSDRVRIHADPDTGAFYAENSTDGLVPQPGAPPRAREDLVPVADYSLEAILSVGFVSLAGMGLLVYVMGAITSFFVDGGYRELRDLQRTLRRVSHLKDHVVLCGAGPTAVHTLDRLVAAGTPVLVLDADERRLAHLVETHPEVPRLRVDPTDIEALEIAGVRRALGVFVAMENDNDNLVAVVTVKEIRKDVRVLCAAHEPAYQGRLRRAGAEEVIAPSLIGGMRLASEAIRPTAVAFLDGLLGHEEEAEAIHFSGVEVRSGSRAEGRTLGDLRFEDTTGARVLAVRPAGEAAFAYNPGPATRLVAGATVAFVGDPRLLDRVRSVLQDAPPGGAGKGAA